MLVDRRLLSQFDLKLFGLMLLVPILGLIVLYSAGYDPETSIVLASWLPIEIKSLAFFKQLFFMLAGVVVMLVAALLPPNWLNRWAYLIYGIGILLLVAVLLVGVSSKGSVRWLQLPGFRFQPSEVMKIGIILAMARYLSRNPPGSEGYGFKDLIIPFSLILIPMGLVMRQPDLGSALAAGGIGFLMVLFLGINFRALIVMFSTLIAGLIPAWLFLLHPYQKRRVLTLLNPEADPLGSGYHITQSKIAVGSGQFFGKGYMEGTQSQLEFLPEHTTDFVFSVLGEEWGFFGVLIVLGAYFLLFLRLLILAGKARDLFASLLVIGVSLFIFIHVFVNVGMVIGLLPVVGIPLPLFSYGGTSLMMNMFALGLVQGVCMRRYIFAG